MVAAAGSAEAATLPKAPDLSGVTAPDSASAGQAVNHAAKSAVGAAKEAGQQAATNLAPSVVTTLVPVAGKLATAGTDAKGVVGKVGKAGKKGVANKALAMKVTKGALHTGGLLGGMPLGG
ncbi:hypothetical protein T261_2924 [Streptomyces lydicus]|nr:hypothetical protein T261_2924 [Streptomyces lydicus]